MSNMSTMHNVLQFNKASKPLSGQRLIRVICKTKSGQVANPNLTESKCVSVPILSAESLSNDQLNALQPAITQLIHDSQSAIVREMILSVGITSISDSDISIDACIKHLNNEISGSRLTKESLEKWFIEEYSDISSQFIAETNGLGSDLEALELVMLEKISKTVSAIAVLFSGWASGKYSPNLKDLKIMKKLIEYIGSENYDLQLVSLKNKVFDMIELKSAPSYNEGNLLDSLEL
jgi:hypothetical protein